MKSMNWRRLATRSGMGQGWSRAALCMGLALTGALQPACGGSGGSGPASSSNGGSSGEGGAPDGGSGGLGQTGGAGGAPQASGGADNSAGSAGDSSGGASGSANSSGGGGGGTSTDLDTYCSEIAERYFDWLANCYGTMAYPESYRESFTTNSRERCLRVEGSVEAGRLAFDGVRANTCLEAIDIQDCDGFSFIDGISECVDLFAPRVESGGDCYPDAVTYFSITGAPSECVDGFCDTGTDQACPGTCEPLKSDGMACTSTRECAPESYCNGTECAARVGLDDPCVSDEECLDELSCSYPLNAESGFCKEPSKRGDACSDDEPCVGGYFCSSGECVSKAETGEECFAHHHCWNDERCIDRDADGDAPRTCGEAGTEGMPCGSTFDCESALFCDATGGDAGSCSAKLQLGDPCSIDGSCVAGAFCNQEAAECQEVADQGESCLVYDSPWLDSACAEGLGCMSNGECHPPVGQQGEPCRTTNETSCEAGLFCSRESFDCETLGAEGDFCNPFWRTSCEQGLACVCSGDTCESGADANVHDTLHTCQPPRPPGDTCYRDYECPPAAFCQEVEGERRCVTDSVCI